MYIDTSELCDIYADQVDVVEPIFSSFGGVSNFYGKVTTVKCFENNGLIAEILEENGEGRVLVVDGGGAVRRALIDAELALLFMVQYVKFNNLKILILVFMRLLQFQLAQMKIIMVKVIFRSILVA